MVPVRSPEREAEHERDMEAAHAHPDGSEAVLESETGVNGAVHWLDDTGLDPGQEETRGPMIEQSELHPGARLNDQVPVLLIHDLTGARSPTRELEMLGKPIVTAVEDETVNNPDVFALVRDPEEREHDQERDASQVSLELRLIIMIRETVSVTGTETVPLIRIGQGKEAVVETETRPENEIVNRTEAGIAIETASETVTATGTETGTETEIGIVNETEIVTAIENGTETENGTENGIGTETGKETRNASVTSANAPHHALPQQPPACVQPATTKTWRNGNSRKSRSAKKKLRPTWLHRRTHARKEFHSRASWATRPAATIPRPAIDLASTRIDMSLVDGRTESVVGAAHGAAAVTVIGTTPETGIVSGIGIGIEIENVIETATGSVSVINEPARGTGIGTGRESEIGIGTGTGTGNEIATETKSAIVGLVERGACLHGRRGGRDLAAGGEHQAVAEAGAGANWIVWNTMNIMSGIRSFGCLVLKSGSSIKL